MTSTATRIEVHRRDGRVTCTLRSSHLRARRIDAPHGRVRVALVATVALLLAGDHVRIEVVVGAGIDLEIVEIAGTVAYDMRGASATWDVDACVEDGAVLVWEGLPFVVSGGADVMRSTTVALEGAGRAVLRDTYVFGRTGEIGGDLRTSTIVTADDRPLLVEDLDLGSDVRTQHAVMSGARCLDAVTILGARLDAGAPDILQLAGPGSIARHMTDSLHTSGLAHSFQVATEVTRRRNTPSLTSRHQLEPIVGT